MPSKQYTRAITDSDDNGGALLLLNSPRTAPLPPKAPPADGYKNGGSAHREIRLAIKPRKSHRS